MASGCGVGEWMGFGKSPQEVANQERANGKESFEAKLAAAIGQPVAKVRKEWGALDGGLSRAGLTVFQWRQTAKLTLPEGMAPSEGTAGQTTLASCLAMFIVRDGVVMDATSEGQCFDYSRMPAWQPYITQSTDGRQGTQF